MRKPWTQAELDAAIPRIDGRIAAHEFSRPDAKPLLPMTLEEGRDFFHRFMSIARERPLTGDECFLFGQWLAVFESAVKAEMLAKKGRFFILSEADIRKQLGLSPS